MTLPRQQVQATIVDGKAVLVCMWFGPCENTTLKAYDHPVLGPTPMCWRCQARMGVKDGLMLDCAVTIEGAEVDA